MLVSDIGAHPILTCDDTDTWLVVVRWWGVLTRMLTRLSVRIIRPTARCRCLRPFVRGEVFFCTPEIACHNSDISCNDLSYIADETTIGMIMMMMVMMMTVV